VTEEEGEKERRREEGKIESELRSGGRRWEPKE